MRFAHYIKIIFVYFWNCQKNLKDFFKIFTQIRKLRKLSNAFVRSKFCDSAFH